MKTEIKLKEREWNKLLNKIEAEEVILILGDELSMLNISGKQIQLRDFLLHQLVDALNDDESNSAKLINKDDIKSFSDISYESMKGNWQQILSDPYAETVEVLSNISPNLYETEALNKLLSIDKFKIILSTGFDDIAYSVLLNLYGEKNLMRLGYVQKTNGQDIPLKTDQRVFYHLFGRASSERHSFVLSEDDLLEFIHFWMDPNYRPKELSKILSNKYILVVGCSYPNWLFRFFFHSLKYVSEQKNEGKDNGLLSDSNLDPELVSFLRRMETSVHEDAISFIDELYERWQKRVQNSSSSDSTNVLQEPEAFISYASEDYHIVSEIVDIFKELGYNNIWFDKKDLEVGDKYERIIKHKIEKAKVFIPVLSPNTENTDGGRFFRKEWKWAKDVEESHFGTDDNFIRPILINDLVMPTKHVFSDCHCVDMSNSDERRIIIRRMIRNLRK